nr:aminotransferase class I/II-fold pyridoxal phosphate-dependent enzyme [Glycomyces harbinensis]
MTSSPLALLGGTPAVLMSQPHFTWPPVTDATRKAVADQLDRAVSIYDCSGVVAELEDALADYFGVRYAVLTSSGTAALYSMYAVAGIGPGMEVIVPAYTFFATVTPLLHLGATRSWPSVTTAAISTRPTSPPGSPTAPGPSPSPICGEPQRRSLSFATSPISTGSNCSRTAPMPTARPSPAAGSARSAMRRPSA